MGLDSSGRLWPRASSRRLTVFGISYWRYGQSVVRQSGIYNKFWLDILKEEYHDVYGPACMDAGNVGNVKADLVMKGKCLFDITFTELDNGYLQGSWDPYGTNNFDGAAEDKAQAQR